MVWNKRTPPEKCNYWSVSVGGGEYVRFLPPCGILARRTRKGRKRRGSPSSEEGGGVSLKSQFFPYPSLCPFVSHCQDRPPPLHKERESCPNHRLWGDLMSVKRPRYVDRCLLWLCLLCAVCYPPPASPDDKCLGGGITLIAACEVFLWAKRL